jgi:hypothetical protein
MCPVCRTTVELLVADGPDADALVADALAVALSTVF